jgi:hypothetical protein
VLLATVFAAAPCSAQQDSAPARRPYSLLSLNAGVAVGPLTSALSATPMLGVQFTRVVPRTPSIDAGVNLLWFPNDVQPRGVLLDLGLAYAVPTSRTVSIVPTGGVTAAGAYDADGGGGNAGVYLGANAIWRAGSLTLRGGLVWRGFGAFSGELANLVSGTIGVGLVF